jgi:hypothetical protein
MKGRKRVLRVGLLAVLCCVLAVPPLSFAATPLNPVLQAAQTNAVIITEIQTASAITSSEEFIELYNNTDEDIHLGDPASPWKLQYFSSSKFSVLVGPFASDAGWTSPYRTIALTGVVPAHEHYLLAATNYLPGSIVPEQTYTSTLADEGALQLVNTPDAETVLYYDRVLWANDQTLPAGEPVVPAPERGASVQRIPNEDLEYENADGTLTPFALRADVTPHAPWVAPIIEEPTEPEVEELGETVVDETTPPQTETPATNNEGLVAPYVTELLPNPASPQTDEQHEYIELYNPNDTAFNLKGYTLETGETTVHSFTFTSDTLLEPRAHQAFYAAVTRLPLSNTAGQARLLDAMSVVLSQTERYEGADAGVAWALDQADGTWKWSTTPTPAMANAIVVPVVAAKAAKAATKTTAKKAVAKKVKGTTTTKVKKAKAAKVAKLKKEKDTTKTVAATTTQRPSAPIHYSVLAVVAGLAVAYGVYEYRHDLANRIHQFRSNRTTRRAARS